MQKKGGGGGGGGAAGLQPRVLTRAHLHTQTHSENGQRSWTASCQVYNQSSSKAAAWAESSENKFSLQERW